MLKELGVRKMLYNNAKKAIVLKNLNSHLIDEAIVFLKKDLEYNEYEDVVSQAERVISEYIDRHTSAKSKKMVNFKTILFWLSGLLSGMVVYSLIYYFF